MKNKKSLAVILLLCGILAIPAHAEKAPEVSAKSAILVDAETGRSLWEKEPDEPRLIASTTKIMTALLALENLDPDQMVVADPAWTGIEGSTMYLQPGQELTVRELLCGLMLASGNDAAVALACLTAGSVEAFAALMNARAEELGCRNTHFENPNGLDGEAHYSSARDLALIAREALKNEDFRAIVSTRTAAVGDQVYTNHNRLLWECEGVFGVKTGYTQAAGRTLVSCCEREGHTLICVTLSDADDWVDHSGLYDWAFAEYETKELVMDETSWTVPVIGGAVESVPLALKEPLTVFCCPDDAVNVTLEVPRFVYASVSSGETAGRAIVSVEGVPARSVELLYARDVPRAEAAEPMFRDWLNAVLDAGERKIYSLS